MAPRTCDRGANDRPSTLRLAARGAGVELPHSYAARIVREAGSATAVSISPLGSGVVIHTIPPNKRSLPILLGYADSRGQWHRDGTRHLEGTPVEPAAVSEHPSL